MAGPGGKLSVRVPGPAPGTAEYRSECLPVTVRWLDDQMADRAVVRGCVRVVVPDSPSVVPIISARIAMGNTRRQICF